MNTENFEALMERMTAATTSSITIDVDPNWFNGSCIRASDQVNIYLVMKGEKRYIPNTSTYNNIFKDVSNVLDGGKYGPIWNKVVDSIPKGEDITNGAILIKADNSNPIYLLTNNKKYYITDPKQYADCNFKPGGQKTYPAVVIDAMPRGEDNVFKPTEVK